MAGGVSSGGRRQPSRLNAAVSGVLDDPLTTEGDADDEAWFVVLIQGSKARVISEAA
jgi:hypothetical protein